MIICSMLVCKLSEFAVEWIPAIKNKAEIIFNSKSTCITAINDTKIISIFCESGVLGSLPKSAVQIK